MVCSWDAGIELFHKKLQKNVRQAGQGKKEGITLLPFYGAANRPGFFYSHIFIGRYFSHGLDQVFAAYSGSIPRIIIDCPMVDKPALFVKQKTFWCAIGPKGIRHRRIFVDQVKPGITLIRCIGFHFVKRIILRALGLI